jgi:hypothetical protein
MKNFPMEKLRKRDYRPQLKNILFWEKKQKWMYRAQGIIAGAVGVGVIYFALTWILNN